MSVPLGAMFCLVQNCCIRMYIFLSPVFEVTEAHENARHPSIHLSISSCGSNFSAMTYSFDIWCSVFR